MKSFTLLPLAAIASAFVIPDAETAKSLQLQLQDNEPSSIWDKVPDVEQIWADAEARVKETIGCARHKISEAADSVYETAVHYDHEFKNAIAGEAWLTSYEATDDLTEGPPEGPPHHGPPGHHGPPDHHGPPGHGPPGHGPPGHGPPDHRPHHPPGHEHGPPNQTVYELISKSKYTTKLAKLINDYPDLVDLLNGTTANFTVFAPTDAAFEKIPEHAPKPSKEQLKKILTYHVSPEFYPAGRVLVTRTIPTALDAEFIKDVPQRLSTQIGFKGLTVNFYARIVAIDIFGTNGVIHGIDSILLPPPKVVDIITYLPGEFSTLELALYKTGLFEAFNDTSNHNGGTLFAPSNFAFQRLGPRINGFLFSKYGVKYLKALILYHASDSATLYSDAIYKNEEAKSFPDHRIPKGIYHIDLETGLEGKHLSIDIARYGRLITIKINGFTRVAVSDGIAADGVIHVLPNVLIPPKEPTSAALTLDETWTIEEIKEHLAPFVEEGEENVHDWEL